MGARLVICCDGTWNTAGQQRDGVDSPTNVVKLSNAVPQHGADGVQQHVYYREGVGTKPWERLRGGIFGIGLSRNVLHAYQWLVETYQPGDEIFLFGFSRGAFTVRSLAGLIRNSGILRRSEAGRVKAAYRLYRSKEGPDAPRAQEFRRAYAHETRIHFVGVWDTVGELGVPLLGPRWLKPLGRALNRPWTFHDTRLSTHVDGAFHALAIDEQRSVFEPTLWHQQPDAAGQRLEQVWFTGVHCSVGGGLASTALSDLTLSWMAGRAGEFGLQVGALGGSADPLAPFETSRTGIYRLSRPLNRAIGRARSEPFGIPDGRESISASATERFEKDPAYRPPGLLSYLQS